MGRPHIGQRLGKLLIAVAVLACLASILVATLARTHAVQSDRLDSLYAEVAERSLAREYRRSPSTPGWALEEGKAADLYRQIYDECSTDDFPQLARNSINLAIRATIWETIPVENRGHFEDPAAAPLATECAALSSPAGEADWVMAQLEPDACALIVDCDPTLDLLVRASRSEDMTSLFHIWSEWSIDDTETDLRMPGRINGLNKLLVLRGHASLLKGDRQAWLDDSTAALRASVDVSRGAALRGLVSISLPRSLACPLEAALRRPDLTAEEADRIYREIGYILGQPIDLRETFEDEFLSEMGRWVRPRGQPFPVARLRWARYPPTTWDHVALALHLDELLQMWTEMWDLQDQPFPERLAGYDRIQTEWPRYPSPHLTLYPAAGPLFKFDLGVTSTECRLRLVQLAAAAAAMRIRTGTALTAVEDLAGYDPDIVLEDPLTALPYALKETDGGHVLYSRALDDPEGSGIARNRNWDPEPQLALRLPNPLPGHGQEQPAQ